ncbi:MAG: hypothetical protein KAS69_07970 [Planctomycetes bacterium]|nr:hypothetical protein [Planctomycetota bacterium]
MLETTKYHYCLKKLYKEQQKTSNLYSHLIVDAKNKKKPQDEIEKLRSEEMNESQIIDEKIGSLVTQRLCKKADQLMVPIPDYHDEEYWNDMCVYRQGRILTTKGVCEVKKAIRAEKRERREGFVVWMAALTGIIGAITGLVAVVAVWKR